jgi:hypothetical protein
MRRLGGVSEIMTSNNACRHGLFGSYDLLLHLVVDISSWEVGKALARVTTILY